MKIAKTTWVLVALLFLATPVRFAVAQEWASAGPAPRYFHSAVLDVSTNRMIVFGGNVTTANANPATNSKEVWIHHGNNWISVKPSGTPPTPRNGHSAVYDPGSNRMIVFGGSPGPSLSSLNDVWVLTSANDVGGTPAWVQLSPSGGPPSPRLVHGAVYDPFTNTMIIFGGDNCTPTFCTVLGDVWVLSNANGLGGTPVWTQLSPSGGPGVREANGSVVYDGSNNRMILFGGFDGVNVFNDVWVLSNANGSGGTPAWTQLFPSGTPPSARTYLSSTYNAANNRMTIFGGQTSSKAVLGDTWVLSNANGLTGTPSWTQLDAFTVFPEARSAHTAVYNPSTNKMTIFGGLILNTAELLATNDVWVLSHADGL